MKALILNSGIGHRMGALTRTQPKCMTEIGGGYTILSHQLTQLAHTEIREVVITTGPFADQLRAYVESLGLQLEVSYVQNPDYAASNYIVSMHLAAPLLRGADVYLTHGDLVMEDAALGALLSARGSVMAVDSSLPLPQKDFKAQLREGRIVAVGVDRFGADCVTCQPAYKWLAADFARWLDALAAFVARGERGVYAENAFNAEDGAIPLWPMELCGRLCGEIDNPDDLRQISARFETLLPNC
ncbi:MAG: NTP transferase domain-containing protein [Clostridia bacterium]